MATSKISGEIDIPTAIAIAQLALKHRENKNLRQRIIVFVASPLGGQAADEKAMVKLAKKLKKNNVAIDVVCFGDGIEEPSEDGKTVLRTFVESANSSDNSFVQPLPLSGPNDQNWFSLTFVYNRHLVIAPPSSRLLSEQVGTSVILAADRGAGIPEEFMPREGGAPSTSNTNEFEFGFDPSSDPELAMVTPKYLF